MGDTPSPVPAAPPGRNRRLRWLWGAVLVLGLCLICASLVYLIDEAGLLSQIRQGGVGSSSGAGVPPATTMVPARTPQASPSVERSYSSDLAVPLTPGGNLTPTLALTRESEASETLTPSPR
jgi:hypothetical protein